MLKRIIVWLPLIILAMVLLYFIVNTDHSNYIPSEKTFSQTSSFILKSHLNIKDSTDLVTKFPYQVYLDSADRWNFSSIKNDLKTLDNTYSDSLANRETLSTALTSKLFSRIENELNVYNPDSLIILIQWAEKFHIYASVEPENEILYSSIYSYWINTVANKLAFYSTKNNMIKYDFKYKYISARLMEMHFTPPPFTTKLEKVIDNIVQKKWSHLIESSWNQTSLLTKMIFCFLLLITAYGYYCIIKIHFLK